MHTHTHTLTHTHTTHTHVHTLTVMHVYTYGCFVSLTLTPPIAGNLPICNCMTYYTLVHTHLKLFMITHAHTLFDHCIATKSLPEECGMGKSYRI